VSPVDYLGLDDNVPADWRAFEVELDRIEADDAEWFAARDAAIAELTEHRTTWEAFIEQLRAV
jgi:hypothetical protein